MDTSKANIILRKVSNVLIVTMPIFAVVLFLWMQFSNPLVFYVSNYQTVSCGGGIVLSASFIFTMFTLISTRHLGISGLRILGVSIFIITMPLCCLGSALSFFAPTVLDIAVIDTETYYLTAEPEFLDAHVFHYLYKCNNNSFQCEQTPYRASGDRLIHLLIDKNVSVKEIHVTYTGHDGFTRLEYTYGTKPRYYHDYAQRNDHLYYLAYFDNPESDSTTFLLYKCKLDNTSCKQLPIRYEGSGYIYIAANETTEEIQVFTDSMTDQDTLIFTWGKEPRCYVDGCEILEDVK